MAKKPKPERVTIEVDERTAHLVRVLEFVKFIEKTGTASAKDKLLREILGRVNVEYKTDGVYGLIYEGDFKETHIEISSWSSQHVSWQDRYNALHERVTTFLGEKSKTNPEYTDFINGILVFLGDTTKSIEDAVGKGEKQYKPKISATGVDFGEDRILLVDAALRYWCDE